MYVNKYIPYIKIRHEFLDKLQRRINSLGYFSIINSVLALLDDAIMKYNIWVLASLWRYFCKMIDNVVTLVEYAVLNFITICLSHFW